MQSTLCINWPYLSHKTTLAVCMFCIFLNIDLSGFKIYGKSHSQRILNQWSLFAGFPSALWCFQLFFKSHPCGGVVNTPHISEVDPKPCLKLEVCSSGLHSFINVTHRRCFVYLSECLLVATRSLKSYSFPHRGLWLCAHAQTNTGMFSWQLSCYISPPRKKFPCFSCKFFYLQCF